MNLPQRVASFSSGLLLVIAFFISQASAGTFPIFGPQKFQRNNGQPQTSTVTFPVLNTGIQYTLHIQNSGVTDAVVSVNGKTILTEVDFEAASVIDRTITLLANNTVQVTVKGKLGTSFLLSVLGIDNDRPLISTTATPAANNFSWNNTNVVVTFICSDAISGIAICPPPVTVSTEGAGQVISGTAVDRAGNRATASITLNIDKTKPLVSASAQPPTNSANWNNSAVTVNFLCSDALSGIASCSSPVILSNEGANQVAAGTAIDKAGNTAAASDTVNIDRTPPIISVASPADNSTVASSTLQITGSVTDTLSGVALLSCNSVAAVFQNGSFSCSLGLTPGANSITLTATDVAGNIATRLLSITLANNAQPVIADFTPKSGPVGTLVTLTGSNLTSGNTAQVTLTRQGGGTIAAPISSASSTNISFVIPAGAASGLVTVTAANQSTTSTAALDVTATSSFALTAGPGTATVLQGRSAAYSISLDSPDGFSQLAKLSISGLPAGVTASFAPQQITTGQISILTVNAPANQTVGNSSLTISAAATVDGIPSTQTANVTLAIQPVTTSFFGRVVESDTIESPLPGIVITFLGVDDAAHPTGCSGRTVADAAGNFIFTNLSDSCTGRQLVQYDGLTAADGEAYAGVNLAYTIIKGQVTGPELVHLPRIDNAETFMVKQNAPTDQTFSFKTIPGVTVTVYAGTIFTLPSGGQPDPFPFTGVQVPVDRLPDTPVDGPGTIRAAIVAFQPADTNSNQPVAVNFPNFLNTPPGVNMELDTLDPVVGDLVKYGTGTVSGDGTQVIPDPDPARPGHRYGIQHFDWHGPMSPAPNALNPGPDPNGPTGGDPVDPASGLFVMSKTDIAFGGARGQVAITRTYRTLAATPGPFGVGTNHNYSYQLNTFSFVTGGGSIVLLMPDGNQFQFIRQADGTFINSTIPALRGAVLTASQPNYTIRYKDGTTFKFASPSGVTFIAYLSSIKDRNGNVTSFVRNNAARPVQITQIIDPVGRQLNFTYDTFDRITSITDPIGRVVSYTYNDQGTLATVTDAAGGVTRYTYDPQNRITAITDPRGITYLQNVYDGNGKVVKQIAADGGVTQFAYTLLNPNASVTLGATATTINTSPVLLTVVTDPLGNRTTYHYSAQGFLIDVADALGQKTIYEREPGTNLVLSVTDQLNRTTAYNYDSLGNILTSTLLARTPNAVTKSFTYDAIFNKIITITDPLGHVTKMAYDPAGNLLSTTNALDEQSTFTYDANGEQLTATDPLGNTIHFSYTNGDLVQTTDALGRTATRVVDGVGRMSSLTNPAGQTSSYRYNTLNQVVSVTDPLGGITAFSYDGNGNLLSVSDALDHVTKYTYDSVDRLAERTDPLGNTDTYQYDPAGNLIQFTDRRGIATKYTYDVLNRKTAEQFGVESSIEYGYDSAGRLTQALGSLTGPITRSYDGLDRLISEITAQGSVTYTYDADGRRSSMQISGQPPILYSYDAANRLTQVSQNTSVVTFVYDAAGRKLSVMLPNGVLTAYQYDAASQLTTIQYSKSSTSLGNLSYTYDLAGRRTQVGGSLARTGLPLDLAGATYNAANELTAFGAVSISYDKNGNILSDGSNSYAWNARNQLSAVNGSALQYDAFGRRIQDSEGTEFVYDGVTPVQELKTGSVSGNLLTGLEVDQYFQHTTNSQVDNYLTDALGSTIALTGITGDTLTSYTYDPFGNTVVSGASENAFQYTGRENDGDGLYYYRARYYSPRLQRFVSEDPYPKNRIGTHLYSYVNNNPLTSTDPFGMFTFNIGGNINVELGPIHIQFSGGFVFDLHGNIGVYNTGGAGGGVGAGAGLSLTGGVSSARTICGFGGPFVEVGGNAGLGPGGGASGYVGQESDGTPIIGGSISGGFEGGAESYVDITITSVTPLAGRKRQTGCP